MRVYRGKVKIGSQKYEKTIKGGAGETGRQGDKETRGQEDRGTRRQGDKGTGGQGDKETRRQGDKETGGGREVRGKDALAWCEQV